ncbi:MAG: glycosyltransferase family 39 protein [Endomicrobiaceae bacterium]|nr:glycosyltransferase family 39 protein [Endomicrobiaceae bacterium]
MSYNKTIKFDNSAIIFVIIAVWYAVTNFLWWKLNTPNFPCYDSAAVHFLYIFNPNKSNNPLIIWIFDFLLSVFGNKNVDAVTVCVNYIFFLIPLYFIYKTGKEIDSKETGNTAMILFALVPAVYGLSRQFGHKDYHLIAAMTVNVYCLIKTNNFQDKKWSIIYGVSLGIGLLIKDTILIYLLPTFLWAIFVALKEKFEIKKTVNILISFIVCSLIAGWISYQPYAIRKVAYDPITLVAPIFSLESLRVMTLGLYEELLSLPIFLIFLIGLVYFLKKYQNKNKILILLWIFVPWGIIFFMPHYKVSEYYAGIIPAVVLICSIFISHIRRNDIKKMLFVFLITIGIVQYINFSYYPMDLFSKLRIKIYGIDLMYYNTATENIMNFDVKNRCEKVSKVIQRIKTDYPASHYAVYVTMESAINNKVIRVCMLLNDMICDVRNIEKFEIIPEDEVVIIVGKFMELNALQRQEIIFDNHPRLVHELKFKNTSVAKYLGQYSEELKNQVQFMDKNFSFATNFYFNDEVNENNKITIYKKIK